MRAGEKIEIILSFGANLPSKAGKPLETLKAAIGELPGRLGTVAGVSGFYRSKAVTLKDQESVPDFVNACALVHSVLSAPEVIETCQQLENAYGRKPAARWSARPLDVDLIAYGDQVLPSSGAWWDVVRSADPAAILPEPVVPHPRAHLRGFVMVPLRDIAPYWVHPVINQGVKAMLEEIESSGGLADLQKIA